MSRLLLTELLSKTDLDNLPRRSLAGSAKNRQVSAPAVPFVGGRGHKGGTSQAARELGINERTARRRVDADEVRQNS
jgi:hypothetical protein